MYEGNRPGGTVRFPYQRRRDGGSVKFYSELVVFFASGGYEWRETDSPPGQFPIWTFLPTQLG